MGAAPSEGDGIVKDEDEAGEDHWGIAHGLLFLVNCDDDGNDLHDNGIRFTAEGEVVVTNPNTTPPTLAGDEECIRGPQDVPDISPIRIRVEQDPAGGGVDVRLESVHRDMRGLRLYERRRAGAARYWGGPEDFADPLDATLEPRPINDLFAPPDAIPGQPIEVGGEGCFFRWTVAAEPQYYEGEVGLRLVAVIDGVEYEDNVRLGVAPFIVLPHPRPAQSLYAENRADNQEYLATLATSGILETYPPEAGRSRWAQDVVEIGYTGIPGSRMHVFLRLPGAEGRSQWVIDHSVGHGEPNRGEYRLRDLIPDASGAEGGAGNYGGNLEIIPPYPVRPAGRIVVGNTMGERLIQLLNDQFVQGPVVIVDTNWLLVGHVDEMLNFRADPNSPLGWSILAAGPVDAVENVVPQALFYGHFFGQPSAGWRAVVQGIAGGPGTPSAVRLTSLPPEIAPGWFLRVFYATPETPGGPTAAGQVARISAVDFGTNTVLVDFVWDTGDTDHSGARHGDR